MGYSGEPAWVSGIDCRVLCEEARACALRAEAYVLGTLGVGMGLISLYHDVHVLPQRIESSLERDIYERTLVCATEQEIQRLRVAKTSGKVRTTLVSPMVMWVQHLDDVCANILGLKDGFIDPVTDFEILSPGNADYPLLTLCKQIECADFLEQTLNRFLWTACDVIEVDLGVNDLDPIVLYSALQIAQDQGESLIGKDLSDIFSVYYTQALHQHQNAQYHRVMQRLMDPRQQGPMPH